MQSSESKEKGEVVMLEILKILRDTPLPIVLVIGGLIFLLVPFIRSVSDKVEIETTNKGFAGFIGFILLAIGIGLYVIPTIASQASTPDATTIAPSPTLTSSLTATVPPNNSANRPSPVHIVNGSNYSMPEGWFWVCTGDFSTQINGTKKAWYDVGISNTGLVFVLQPNSSFTISGSFEVPVGMDVGDCSPYDQDEKDSAISGAISAQLDRGCGSKCQYVNVIELDKNGYEVSNYWTPQKP
jgi:hypothetical protein